MKKRLLRTICLLAAATLLIFSLSGCWVIGLLNAFYRTIEEEPQPAYKPVIYLYPEEKTEVTVCLDYDGVLTTTYPEYQNEWNVTAEPDGTLRDERGQTYNYLFWEGLNDAEYDFSEGFCVKREDSAAFLEEILPKTGLTPGEANEFIVFWLPKLQESPYNLISFQSERYTDHAGLTVVPEPDSVLRVFMAVRPLNEPIDIPEQTIITGKREGFTVVEWGGTIE